MLTQALRVLWGEQGAVGRCFNVPDLWRAAAQNFSGRSLPCGHYIAEEAPELLLPEIFNFFKEPT
jgi:haloacetate dehalogenase